MPRFERHHEGSSVRHVRHPGTGRIEQIDHDPPWTKVVVVSHRPDENIVRLSLSMGSATRRLVRRFNEGPFFAKTYVAEVAAALLHAGYEMSAPDEQLAPSKEEVDPASTLLSRMAEGDQDAYLVHADALLDRGDPRGELITLLTKDPREPGVTEAVKQWMDQHPASGLVPHEIAPRLSFMQPTWRLGFLSSIRIGYDLTDAPSFDAAALVRILCTHPVAQLLQSITIEQPTAPSPFNFYDYGRPMMGIAMYGPESLRSIAINDLGDDNAQLGDATFFWLAFPNLEELTLRGTKLDLGAVIPRKLRRLLIDPCEDATLAAITRTPSFPLLEYLHLGSREFTTDRRRFPKLSPS